MGGDVSLITTRDGGVTQLHTVCVTGRLNGGVTVVGKRLFFYSKGWRVYPGVTPNEDAPPYKVNTNSNNNNLLLLDNQPLFGSRHWRSASAALDFLDGAMFKLGHAHCARINLHFICSCN